MMIGKTFISYRRDGDAGFAGRLYDRLKDSFGETNVFFDIDNFSLGIDFVRELDNQISICDILLVIIGRDWLMNDRLSKTNDFVRIEIELALDRRKRIIPVLVNNATMPLPEQLPESIRPLAFRNAALLSHQSFRADSERIITALNVIFVEIGQKAEEERKRAKAGVKRKATGERVPPATHAAQKSKTEAHCRREDGTRGENSSNGSPLSILVRNKRSVVAGIALVLLTVGVGMFLHFNSQKSGPIVDSERLLTRLIHDV